MNALNGNGWRRGEFVGSPRRVCYVRGDIVHFIGAVTRASDVVLTGDIIEVDFGIHTQRLRVLSSRLIDEGIGGLLIFGMRLKGEALE